MTDQQQLARVAVLQAAILKELHAADEDLRSRIMPVNDRYPLRDVLAAFDARLELPEFTRMMRARRDSIPWRVDLLVRARQRGHLKLASQLAQWMMADRPHWKIRYQKRELAAALAAAQAA